MEFPERPADWLIELLDRATYLRGRYLTSYAQCEYLMADLTLRVGKQFKYKIGGRISAAREMAQAGGPLCQYAGELIPLIDHFPQWEDHRHSLVHGFMTLCHDSRRNHFFRFQRYEKIGDELTEIVWEVSTGALEDIINAITTYTSNFVDLHKRIHLELHLRG